MSWPAALSTAWVILATTQPASAEPPGQRVFLACETCHSLQAQRNGIGPSLHDILGRPAGTVEGFRYSNALRRARLTWNRDTLGRFLRDPQGLLPGNRMAFSGLESEADIQGLIDYLDRPENGTADPSRSSN